MKFYNEAIKNRYLETIENEDSRTTISYIFLASKSAEENVLGKDLYNFSKEEVGEVMKNLPALTNNSARGNMNNIKAYISWSIRNGYRDNNLNPLDGLGREWYSKFVDRTTKIHYSYEEFIDLVEELPNSQDQAFLALLWEGLNLDELREIHYNDINWNENKITIRKRNEEVIDLDDQFMRYIERGYKDSDYKTYKGNGEHTERELLPSDYLFKNLKSPRTKEGNPVTNAVFYTRLANIKNEFDLSYLTPNALKQSGQIHLAAQLYEKHGELDKAQFAIIGDKYKLTKMTAGEYEYYNRSLMSEYISSENLKDLYNIDIKF